MNDTPVDDWFPVDDWKNWRTTKLQAYTWWCRDEDCDCTQPRIDRVTPNTVAGFPWIDRELVWEGEFITYTYELDADERERRQYAPGRAACIDHGVPIPDEWKTTDTP